jgi:hypothetical protein
MTDAKRTASIRLTQEYAARGLLDVPKEERGEIWLRQVQAALEDVITELWAQRDELLAACEYAIGCAEGRIRDYDGVLQPKLKAAVAKAKGQDS